MKELIKAILEAKSEKIYVLGSSAWYMSAICKVLAMERIPILARTNSFEATVGEVTVSVYFVRRSDMYLAISGTFLRFDTEDWDD